MDYIILAYLNSFYLDYNFNGVTSKLIIGFASSLNAYVSVVKINLMSK